MKLSNTLIKNFADIINKKTSETKTPKQLLGTVVDNGKDGITYVRLDGAQSLTPVKLGVGAKNGDTVLVTIENHTATVIGNISAPASATIADNFMRFDEEGLAIGKLENEKPVGSYCLIDPNNSSFSIKNEDGSAIASFAEDTIRLGHGDDNFTSIDFYNNKGHIDYSIADDALVINNGSSRLRYSRIWLGDSLTLSSFGYIHLVSESGDPPYTSHEIGNNQRLIDTQDIKTHLVTIDVTATTAASAYKEISVNLAVPTNHRVVGVLQIRTNHRDIFRLTSWGVNPNNANLRVAWFNAGTKAYTVKLYVIYLTMPTTTDHQYITENTITVSE